MGGWKTGVVNGIIFRLQGGGRRRQRSPRSDVLYESESERELGLEQVNE